MGGMGVESERWKNNFKVLGREGVAIQVEIELKREIFDVTSYFFSSKIDAALIEHRIWKNS